MKYLTRFFAFLLLLFSTTIQAADSQKKLEAEISDSLTVIANSYTWVGKLALSGLTINPNTNTVVVTANERLGYMPFRPNNVKRIYNAIKHILPSKYSGYSISCIVDNKKIEELVPNFYRTENLDTSKHFSIPKTTFPLVTKLSRPYTITKGLQDKNLAVWQSHGWYYEQKLARWEWQRARIFQIVEDLYTQSYVLPFLVPMLENAGANVLMPRERDTQINEVIVDNDTRSRENRYREHNEHSGWKKSEQPGFANAQKVYLQGENPFTMGTYRVVPSETDVNETSSAEWIPTIPETGKYAVYVSYRSLENSVPDAHYTVYHKGGKTDFLVNQTMNGGTWLYLGHFDFDKGKTGRVTLTNFSSMENAVVTADAVKFGGGMGNIARCPNPEGVTSNVKSSDDASLATLNKPATVYEPEVSSYPRYTEAARYWLQWAGVPDSIYSKSQGKNDYTDDYQSRGNWVNYLIGGSSIASGCGGLKVPVDLSFAFHSDAGTTYNDSIIGVLGICTTQNSNGKSTFKSGLSRWTSRDLTDIVQTQITNDIRTTYAPEWTRRGIWNKSYSESRTPEVPAMLLELLSHQNFADMRYGLDPRFRFTVSRSIYKGMLKFLASLNQTEYVVQPLPVEKFSCRFVENNKLELQWAAVTDSLEPTAKAEQYVVYTRVENGGFDNGVVIESNKATLNIEPGKIYSFKVTAQNQGGESFPSEILSAYRAPEEKGEVMIVNDFNRLSAPGSIAVDSTFAGFMTDKDAGVPYISDITFIGKQYEFDRRKPWLDDDAPGFGASHGNYENKVIAGNTFDYPYLHGKSIKAAGYSFVSCSQKSVIQKEVDLTKYKIVDLILGKQKQTLIGNGKKAPEFKTFPLALQQEIRLYCQQGGSLLLSGAYLASDLCEGNFVQKSDVKFIEDVLKYKFRTSQASVGGNVKIVNSPIPFFKKGLLSYFAQPNIISYSVESPDAIEPADEKAFTICRYAENDISAAVAFSGKYKTCAFAFPFETIQSEDDRNNLMNSVLQFFSSQENK